MLLIEQMAAPGTVCSERLTLPFDLRQKSRLRTRLESGEEVGLFLERGTILRGGDCLQGKDGRTVLVVAAAEKTMRVTADTPLRLMQAAYHLGNRHVPLQLGTGWLRLGTDHVLREMLLGLGVQVQDEVAAFEPEAGAYGGHHHHGGEPAGPGVIHQFGRHAR